MQLFPLTVNGQQPQKPWFCDLRVLAKGCRWLLVKDTATSGDCSLGASHTHGSHTARGHPWVLFPLAGYVCASSSPNHPASLACSVPSTLVPILFVTIFPCKPLFAFHLFEISGHGLTDAFRIFRCYVYVSICVHLHCFPHIRTCLRGTSAFWGHMVNSIVHSVSY